MEALHHTHDTAAPAHVEQGSRLVEHEDARLHGERSRDGYALLLSSGQMSGIGLGIAVEAHPVQLAGDTFADLVGRDSEVFGAKGYVLLHDGGDDLVVGVLEHEAQLPARASVCIEVDAFLRADGLADQRDRPLVRRQKSAHDRCERGLSRPVRSEHADALAIGDIQRDVVEGGDPVFVAQRGV